MKPGDVARIPLRDEREMTKACTIINSVANVVVSLKRDSYAIRFVFSLTIFSTDDAALSTMSPHLFL